MTDFAEIAAQLKELDERSNVNLSAFGVPYSKQLTLELVDAGKRVSDVLNQKLQDFGWWEIKRRWMAFRLEDGTSDGVLYDNKKDAVRHQANEFLCAYIQFVGLASGANPRECAIFLKFNRDLYRKGFRMPDPDDVRGGRDVIMTAALRDNYKRILGI